MAKKISSKSLAQYNWLLVFKELVNEEIGWFNYLCEERWCEFSFYFILCWWFIVIGRNSTMMQKVKKQIMDEYEMIDLREMSFFLRMEIQLSPHGIVIGQWTYAKGVLKKFKINLSRPMVPFLAEKRDQVKNIYGAEKVDEGWSCSLIS